MAANDHLIVAAIVVAAGSGSRLGADVPKAFVEVGGRTLLAHAVEALRADARVASIVIAAPVGELDRARTAVPDAAVVAGGATRQLSVASALAAVDPAAEVVLVHDAARAFVPPDVIERVIEALAGGAEAAVPTLPISDTIRTVDPSGELGDLIDRSGLLAMQTPQGFRRDVLTKAHSSATETDATDDAALVEAIGGHVVAVRGDERAFKVTVPLDLALAEVLLRG
jgi:2-C-methyl-D-erythritol 4-phosphate cytidylyltransferase